METMTICTGCQRAPCAGRPGRAVPELSDQSRAGTGVDIGPNSRAKGGQPANAHGESRDLQSVDAHGEHEPETCKSLVFNGGVFRFTESPQSQKMVAHWDHEPGFRNPLEINETAVRFMGRNSSWDR